MDRLVVGDRRRAFDWVAVLDSGGDAGRQLQVIGPKGHPRAGRGERSEKKSGE